MNIFIFDYFGNLALQEKLLKEGNNVCVCFNPNFIEKPEFNKVDSSNIEYNGNKISIANSKKEITNFIKDCDFILYLGAIDIKPNYRRYIEGICKKYSKPIINFPSTNTIKFETDRYYAKKFDCGFDNNDVYTFSSYKEFKEKGLNKLYVIKAVNQHSNKINEQFRTIVPSSINEMDSILKNDVYGHFKSGGVVLEEYINGYEIELAFYWDGSHIVGDILVDQEYKGVLNNEMGGLLCGESGTVLKFTKRKSFKNKFQKIIDKCEKHFKKNFRDYKGFIGLNTICSKDLSKMYLMEYTVRAGLPTEIDVCHMVNNYSNFLKAMAFKKKYTDGYKKGVACGVCMIPYGSPFKWTREGHRIQISGKPDDNILLLAGSKGDVWYFDNWEMPIVSLAFGDYVKDANKKALKSISKIKCWNLMYRTDIGSKWDIIYKALLKKGRK